METKNKLFFLMAVEPTPHKIILWWVNPNSIREGANLVKTAHVRTMLTLPLIKQMSLFYTAFVMIKYRDVA